MLFPAAAIAQVWYVGPKAGMTLSNYKSKTPWKEVTNVGFTAGLTAYTQLRNNFGIGFEVLCELGPTSLQASFAVAEDRGFFPLHVELYVNVKRGLRVLHTYMDHAVAELLFASDLVDTGSLYLNGADGLIRVV